MNIRTIADLTAEEKKTMNTTSVQFTWEEGFSDRLTLEIITSYLPLNPKEQNNLYSSLAVYHKESIIYHEVYRETLTPNQILEATRNITTYPERYLGAKSMLKSLN